MDTFYPFGQNRGHFLSVCRIFLNTFGLDSFLSVIEIMPNLPSKIEDLEILLQDTSLSSCEIKRIKNKIYKKRYAEKNPEKFKKTRGPNNKSYMKKYLKQYLKKYSKSPEQREKRKNNLRNWKIKNKQKVREYKKKRKSFEISLTSDSILKWVLSWRCEVVQCSYCLSLLDGKDAHIEHIFPLSKGGKHEKWNLCIACQSCNSRKKDKMPYLFIKEIEEEMDEERKNLSNLTNFLQTLEALKIQGSTIVPR